MEFKEKINLSDYTTLKVGGPADFFCIVENKKDLLESLRFAKDKNLKVFILGGGSNVLISDSGFRGLVIKMELKGIEKKEDLDLVKVEVGAGENWDDFVKVMVLAGLWGLENLSGIPGTVGASPVQNIGAYGVEVKDLIHSVDVLNTIDFKERTLTNKECEFGYRDSIFKKDKGENLVITSVVFNLKKKGGLDVSYKDLQDRFRVQDSGVESEKDISPVDVREAVLEIRKGKFPDLNKIGTAGSFFKNPIVGQEKFNELKIKYPELPGFSVLKNNIETGEVKISLAWILDKVCGLKGYSEDNISLFEKQPLVLVNKSFGNEKEISTFSNKIKEIVKKELNINIEEEVRFVK